TYPEGTDRNMFINRLVGRLESVPGVDQATVMSGLPPIRDVNANTTEFEGQQVDPGRDGSFTEVDYYQVVTGEYFETMGIPVVQGRAFDASDDAEATPVAIINQRLARAYYPGENPIGRRIRPCCGDEVPWFTIIGIAGDVKQGGLSEETGTELYFYHPQVAADAPRSTNVVVRSNRPSLALMEEVRQTVWSLDRSLPLADLQTMEANLAGSLSRPRFLSLLLTLFAAVALLLAAVGTYGVLSYSVAERHREIGIRMAMGAEARGILGLVLGEALAVAGIGLMLGMAGAFALTRLLESLLFGISSTDATTFLLAPAVLALVAVAACYLPVRRATQVDPMIALRAE
ncbi:MAG: FtsX-like permease family protein, partial [Candidatus Limnocylindria bacterium]